MVRLAAIVQGAALKTQGIAPASLTGTLLGAIGISFHPGGRELRYPGGRPAAACVSIDFDVTKESRRVPNQKGTKLLLKYSEKSNVPLTWAICGKTAEEEPGLIRTMLDSGASHEIASHTYSHLRVDRATPAQLEDDFKRWQRAVAGSAPKTIVFPFNKEGNFETLSRLGFTTFRGEARRIGPPFVDRGSFNISPVLYLSGRTDGVIGTAKRYADLCVRYHSVFHLWTHPWNLSREGEPEIFASKVLGPILSYLKDLDDTGEMGLFTMVQLSEHIKGVGSVIPN